MGVEVCTHAFQCSKEQYKKRCSLQDILLTVLISAGHTVGHAFADLHCILQLHLSIARFQAVMRAARQPVSKPAAHQHASSAMPLENGNIHHRNQDNAGWQQPSEPAEAPKGATKRKRAPDEGVIEAQAKRSRHAADMSLNGQPHDRQQQSSASEQGSKSKPLGEGTGRLEWRCQHSCRISIASVACASACLQVAPDAQAIRPFASVGHPQGDLGAGLLAEGTSTQQGLPQLTVALQWSRKDCRAAWMSSQSRPGAQHISGTAAAASASNQPRCQIKTEPELPQTACKELAAMAGAPTLSPEPPVSYSVLAKLPCPLRPAITRGLSPPSGSLLCCALTEPQDQCCSSLNSRA